MSSNDNFEAASSKGFTGSTGDSRSTSMPQSLVELLCRRAEQHADQKRYTFLPDGEDEGESLSFQVLDRKARALAALLLEKARPGDRALLFYAQGVDYIVAFFGCLYAGMMAVPAYPPDPTRLTRTLPRFRAIVADAQPTVVLTTSDLLAMTGPMLSSDQAVPGVEVLATDDLPDSHADAWRAPKITGDSVAFLQYTSGSTSTPRGVMVRHANLLHNLEAMNRAHHFDLDSTLVSWLPLYHDLGLIGNILRALHTGAQCVFMPPTSFLQKPLRWLHAISRYRDCRSGGPDFAYNLCVRKITPQERDGLDLRGWRTAYSGAEPVRAETIERFSAYFGPCGFKKERLFPCYGLAEATLLVTGASAQCPLLVRTFDKTDLEHGRATFTDHWHGRRLVSCGTPPTGEPLLIVNPESLQPLPDGDIGEIWVGGSSVAAGYWNRAAETQATFGARPASDDGRAYLRTGDLGFLHEGQLFVTGRLKDLIIVAGANHYPQDIEVTAEQCHSALRPGTGAAFSIDDVREERVAFAIEADVSRLNGLGLSDLCSLIRRAVAENHGLHLDRVALLKPGSAYKTSSGKIQRHACKEALLKGTLDLLHLDGASSETEDDVLPGRSATEFPESSLSPNLAYLRRIIAETLGWSDAEVHPQRHILELGLSSLMVVQLTSRIKDDLGLTIEPKALFEHRSIASLAEALVHDASEGRDVRRPQHETIEEGIL